MGNKNRWFQQHVNDIYVKKSISEGYRSRAAYKLLEIQKKFNIIKPGGNIVDLGSCPGSWSQVAANLSRSNLEGSKNKVLGIDLLNIKPIKGVINIQHDFCDQKIWHKIFAYFNKKVNVVLSDISPNITGHRDVDEYNFLNILMQILPFTEMILKKNGSLICKIFRSNLEKQILERINDNFQCLKYFKPQSSRIQSKEIYLVAQRFCPQ